MSKCPYTWFTSIFSGPRGAPNTSGIAEHLHVKVIKNGVEIVYVTLPAKSAQWLIEIIPDDVMVKIRDEAIPIDDIMNDLKKRTDYFPQPIFLLDEPHRSVNVWLE